MQIYIFDDNTSVLIERTVYYSGAHDPWQPTCPLCPVQTAVLCRNASRTEHQQQSTSTDAINSAAAADNPYMLSFTVCRKESVTDIVRARSGWLVIFCVGLLLAAAVVKGFERFLEQHVQLSLFLPLIMGHGGNAGAQSCSAVLRALALQQVRR